MTGQAATVVSQAVNAEAQERRTRARVYLNAAAPDTRSQGRWLSEVGFLDTSPVSYAEMSPSNFVPADDPEGREINQIYLVPYGLERDAALLSGARPTRYRSSRRQGTNGTAPFPGAQGLTGASDLDEAGASQAKTLAVLAALRQADGGPGYHAVVTRAGAVYLCGPADVSVSPVEDADNAFCVAVESAVTRGPEGQLAEATWTGAQLDALAVLVAKLRAAYPSLLLDEETGVRLVDRETRPDGLAAWFAGDAPATFTQRVADLGEFDAATEVFRRSPPPSARRAEAQVAVGTADTAGESSRVLAAYVGLAAAERSHGVSELSRANVFVQRARVAHVSGDEGAEEAAHAGAADQLVPTFPEVVGYEPHVYNFATGRWGDGETA